MTSELPVPRKSIAIPLNSSARRGARLLAASSHEDAVQTSFAHAANLVRRPVTSPLHRYEVGERLSMAYGGNITARAGAGCKVLSLMPYEGRGPLLYRVRSDIEAFERVVAEVDLSR